VQELLAIFIDNMIPVLTIASIGLFLRRRFKIDPKLVSSMMFNVFSPALTFYSIYSSDINGSDFLRMYGATLVLLWIVAGTGFLILRLQNAKGAERAATLLATFAFNGGNFGLSIVKFAFGDEALSWAVIAFVAGSTTAYTLGVYTASNGRASVTKSLLNVLRTPSIYALVAAFVLKGLGIDTLPPAIDRSVKLLSDASIPLMITLLGLQLGELGTLTRLRLVFTGTTIRLLLAPLISVGIAALFGLTGDARTAFIVQAGMPTAVMTIVLATEFDTDRDLALNLIMATTIISPITLSIIIYLLQNGII
jgi:malate permease and related proteins